MYNKLRDDIATVIKPNWNGEITGQLMQQKLLEIVDNLDLGGLFLGFAGKVTEPDTEANGFYFSTEAGTYTNFYDKDGNPIVVGEMPEIIYRAKVNDVWAWKHETFGGTYVKANPEGEPTETLEKLQIGDKVYTAPQGIQGEPGPANTLSIGTVQSGETAAASITGESPEQVLNLTLPKGDKGDAGQNAVNPFKGWYTTDNIPATGQEGDYCNVTDTSVSPHTVTIYRWNTTQNAFADTGETPDTATGETFASGETLQEVAIDSSGLSNPVNTADPTKPVLAQAEDVMQLKAKLEGVNASENKVQLVTSVDGQNVYDGYIKGSTGEYVQSNYNKFIVVPLNGAKSVRWLGKENASNSSNIGWAFGTFSGEIDSTLSTFTALSKGVYANNPLDNQAVEYIKDAPDNATHAVITIWIYKYEGGSAVTMDNFYCYLQSGENVIDLIPKVVNNLEDGGTDKALSAEQGKLLNDKIYGYYDFNDEDTITLPDGTTGCYQNATSSIADTVKNAAWYNGGLRRCAYIGLKKQKSYGYHYIKVSMAGNTNYGYITFVKKADKPTTSGGMSYNNLVTNGFLSDIHDAYNKVTISCASNQETLIEIPNDAIGIYVQYRRDESGSETLRKPTSIKAIGVWVNGDVERQAASSEKLENDIYGEPKEFEKNIDFTQDAVLENLSLDKTNALHSNSAKCYRVSCEGYDSVSVLPRIGYGTYLFIANEELPSGAISDITSYLASETSEDGYIIEDGSPYRMVISSLNRIPTTIRLSWDAKYIYIQQYFNSTKFQDRTPQSLILVKDNAKYDGVEPQFEQIKPLVQPSNVTLSLYQGDLDSKGKLVSDTTRITTGFIPHGNGFLVTLKDGYNVEKAMLYDTNGNLVNNKYYTRMARFTGGWGSVKELSQFLVRLVIVKDDGGNIGSDNIVSGFVIFNDSRLKRVMPSNVHFREMHTRMNQIQNVVWKNDTKVIYINDKYFNPAVWLGTPYSEPSEFTKYLGMHVSMRTFLTALKNKRSVLYTEQIKSSANGGDISKYGFTYHGHADSGTFYGTVCSGLTSYVSDAKNILSEGGIVIAWGDYDSSTGKSSIHIGDYTTSSVGTIDDLWDVIEPLDMLRNTGHVTIISDVYKDQFDKKQYIVISEQTVPVGRNTPFTKQMLLNRIDVTVNETSDGVHKDWDIRRYNTWGDRQFNVYEDTSKYINDSFMDYMPEELDIDPDISTFEGEYAAFCVNGDEDGSELYNNYKAYLNIHRNGDKYDTLEIYNENTDEIVRTIDISSYESPFNIYVIDTPENEDWIVFDLNTISEPLPAGKYKARVKNISGQELVSGFTHFEMIEVSLEITGSSGNYTAIFGSSNGSTPYLIRNEKINGMERTYGGNRHIELSASDVQDGSVHLPSSWSYNATYPYIKIFVRGQYGVVVKRIDISI